MKFEIITYNKNIDCDLLELFYRSIYYNRKEFEIVRVPNNWIDRYFNYKNCIKLVARDKNKIIGSLGILPRQCIIDGKKVTVGCFIDNCLLPDYRDHYELVFSKLFSQAEHKMKKKGMDILYGWDYIKNVYQHKDFFKKFGFKCKVGINWFAGGNEFFGKYPNKWDGKMPIHWEIVFKLVQFYYRLKGGFTIRVPDNITFRKMDIQDIEKMIELEKFVYNNIEFSPCYSKKEYLKIMSDNSIHGIIAEKDKEIVGIITYFTSAWSGWMFGKPFYDNEWRTFFTFTPDEFLILPDYQHTSLPSAMVLQLMKINDPYNFEDMRKSYGFIADIFDIKMKWRRTGLLKAGCLEAKADYGAILAKSLSKNIELDTNKIWYLPGRYVVPPVPENI